MPAVTVDDILTLPRLREPDPAAAVQRPVTSVTTAPRGFEGEGFPVRRAFAGVDLAALDPFIHMDQMGEVEYAPGEPKGTPWHPHRGFETVTYIIDGTFEHQDSHGGGGVITNGDTQWMTAGGGHPAHRDPAGGAGRLRRPVPRHPALGQPAGQGQDGRRRATRTSAAARSRCCPRPTAARWSGSSPARSTGTRAGRHATRRSPSRTPRSPPAPRLDLPWRPDFNALVYVLAGHGHRRRRAAAGRGPASWPCSAPATR